MADRDQKLSNKKTDKYIPSLIESKWQKIWKEEGIYSFKQDSSKESYYNLVELPYPSGDLHIGHWFTFTTADAHARYQKMAGKNVFFPNGFDAFGLPAENAAIKRNIHPRDWTLSNIETMKKQFSTMGTMIDWSHEAITCLPEYYRWNQWIFIKMYEKGLAYRGKAMSNWCPSCQTVLANEGIEDGKCWRCGSIVEQKEIEQWFLKITDYADRLLWENTDEGKLANGVDWPKSVKEGQNNWIGKSEGVEIEFSVVLDSAKASLEQYSSSEAAKKAIKVFTTRPDTLFGATFLVLAPEHEAVGKILKQVQDDPSTSSGQARIKEEVEDYVAQAKKKTELTRKEQKEKTGVFSGAYAINPINSQRLPIWIADYVLSGYGTGAIMAVPGHDERDHEFAIKYKLSIKKVIDPENEFQSLVMRKSVDVDSFMEEIQELGLQVSRYYDWGLIVSGKEEQQDKYLKTIQKHLVSNSWYVDSDGSFKAVIFKEKVFNLPDESQRAKEYGLKNGIPEEQLDWQEESNYAYCFSRTGVLINSGQFDGQSSKEAQINITNYLQSISKGKKMTTYHLHDWSVSRQRYWGTPVPIIYCSNCYSKSTMGIKGTTSIKGDKEQSYSMIDGVKHKIIPVAEKDLPVELPYEVDYMPKGMPPLATAEEWVNVDCPKCGGKARRDAETLDTFFDSSWYYYRYINPKYDKSPFDEELARVLMPVDIYYGGSEHTLGHTLYARFFTKFFHDIGIIDFEEFAKKRIQHGIILGPDGYRMSKSRGNVVNPDDVVAEYGADTVRMYLGFMIPFEATAPWNTSAISGIYRFLRRVWELQDKCQISPPKADQPMAENVKFQMSNEDRQMMAKTIKLVGEDIEAVKFNTAIARLMEWLNYLSRKEVVSGEEYRNMILMIAPFAPHMAEEVWQSLFARGPVSLQPTPMSSPASWRAAGTRAGSRLTATPQDFRSVHLQSWPEYDEADLAEDVVTIAIQVNGKFRDSMKVQSSKFKVQSEVESMARDSEKVKRHLEGREVKKVIYVEGRAINFVV